ncbi:maleylpyruvate isomerase family mycothiol-dependent enzyme [Nocardia sp. BMG111209]|uniref:maleylpyruvate isomerase family mycothiol-dependent enzyme n=1 Tax=Nocardia sp. BMG111209 TaxID=1160137 RepID=UPI00035D389C|nr:maleylpyruvate isomerase family mycothiol-dependent enzyme [Nocardia sp. BMG111209]
MTTPQAAGSSRSTVDYLASIETDGKALAAIATRHDLELPVPTCPGWTLGDVVAHVAGANRWMTTCVSAGLTAQERILPPGPADRGELLRWSDESLEELLSALEATPPDHPVWTPIRGPFPSVWWRRKAALEVAIHRTDAENAAGADRTVIDARLALDGIDEYAEEFLPLMLHAVPQPPPVTSVLLSPTDIDDTRVLSLIPAGDHRDPGAPTVELVASASDLLLWIWNRVPDGTLTSNGDDTIVTWWRSLAI